MKRLINIFFRYGTTAFLMATGLFQWLKMGRDAGIVLILMASLGLTIFITGDIIAAAKRNSTPRY